MGASRTRISIERDGTSRRALLVGGAATSVLLALPATARSTAPDIVVSRTPGANRVATLAEAISAARAAARPFRIHLSAGDWREKLLLDAPDVTITGEGPRSRIVYDVASGHERADGTRWGTSRSATLTVTAPGVTLERLTVANDFDYLANRRDATMEGLQAVALFVSGDRTIVRDCHINGYQDTLYVRAGELWFERCRITGGVDFIFGGAAARIHDCEIVSRAVPGPVAGYIAAPSTPAVQPVGLVFTDCRLTREAGLGDATVYLGRPWRAGGNMALTGSAAFVRCWMDRHIIRSGWTSMGYSAPGGGRTMLTPQEARLTEFASRGPGAGPANDTRRIVDAQAAAALVDATAFIAWRSRR